MQVPVTSRQVAGLGLGVSTSYIQAGSWSGVRCKVTSRQVAGLGLRVNTSYIQAGSWSGVRCKVTSRQVAGLGLRVNTSYIQAGSWSGVTCKYQLYPDRLCYLCYCIGEREVYIDITLKYLTWIVVMEVSSGTISRPKSISTWTVVN